ncbi:unnamed protein product, partial [Rotaria sordida]
MIDRDHSESEEDSQSNAAVGNEMDG